MIIQRALHFWNEHVLKDQPPLAQTEEDFQNLYSKGDCNKKIEAPTQILELTKRLHILKEEIDTLEQEVSKIKQSVMANMGDAETLTYQGQILATWKIPKESYRLDSKSLEADQPELCKKYKLLIQSSRRLVIKELSL
jgi:predicted phage-related endonuclease